MMTFYTSTHSRPQIMIRSFLSEYIHNCLVLRATFLGPARLYGMEGRVWDFEKCAQICKHDPCANWVKHNRFASTDILAWETVGRKRYILAWWSPNVIFISFFSQKLQILVLRFLINGYFNDNKNVLWPT